MAKTWEIPEKKSLLNKQISFYGKKTGTLLVYCLASSDKV
jgi:hypothetical protein